jgi:valyl-tRNA synthetase
VKPRLAAADRAAAVVAWRNLFAVFDAALRLLHPFMPFLTEELWHRLPQRAGARSIALEAYPAAHDAWRDPAAESQMAFLQEVITAARNARAELKLDPKKKVPAECYAADAALGHLLEENLGAVRQLATLSELRFAAAHLEAAGGVVRSTAQFDLRIQYGEAVDLAAELARLRKERDRLARDVDAKRARLADPAFRSRAPEQVVESLEATLHERETEFAKLAARLERLEKSGGN